MPEIIVNADDFGATAGMTAAIAQAHDEGVVNSTSLMVTMPFVAEAVAMAKERPALKVGLHLNLTNCSPAAPVKDIALLVDENGRFKNGFLNLLLLSFFRPKALRAQIETEAKAQLEMMKKTGLPVSHIDSHRHVHMIPLIFKIVEKLAADNGIDRVRVVNENILNTMACNKGDFSFLFDGGIVKYAVLRALAFWNARKTDTYFYSILYTGKLFKKRFRHLKIPKKYAKIEIGIHPGRPDIERQHPEGVYDPYVLSENRSGELETVLDTTLTGRIS